VTPRVVPDPQNVGRPSFELYRPRQPTSTPHEQRAFWQWATLPAFWNGSDADLAMGESEYRVLSKAASGGGFLVPDDVGEAVTAAARAATPVAQIALEVITAKGETLGMSLASTLGSGSWVAESGSYTASDITVTQQNMGAFKGGTKIIVSKNW
jgi:HK97 family phage major capsid protein